MPRATSDEIVWRGLRVWVLTYFGQFECEVRCEDCVKWVAHGGVAEIFPLELHNFLNGNSLAIICRGVAGFKINA